MAFPLPSTQDVRDITGSKKSDAVITALINTAAVIAKKCADEMDEERATLIVLWLAAHLLASAGGSSEGNQTSRKLGDAQTSWATAVLGDGLKGTSYGQQVLLLDSCGCLQRLGREIATVEVLL